MNFKFLYKDDRHLFSIGMNMAVGKLDASCYDLMASEACLSSFLADRPRRCAPATLVPDRPAFHRGRGAGRAAVLGRLDVRIPHAPADDAPAQGDPTRRGPPDGRRPSDRIRPPEGGPLGDLGIGLRRLHGRTATIITSRSAPRASGLKRDIGNDLVITPYATALAVAVHPREALENFKKLAAEGGEGRYGFYEAVDFTRERVPKGKKSVVVRVVHGPPPRDEPGGPGPTPCSTSRCPAGSTPSR